MIEVQTTSTHISVRYAPSNELEIELLGGIPNEVILVPQGPPGSDGLPGTSVGVNVSSIYKAGTALSGHRMVSVSGPGQVDYPDVNNTLSMLRVIGMTSNAAGVGEDISVVRFGQIEHSGWSWTPGLPVFCGVDGVPTQTQPDHTSLKVAIAIDETTLEIFIRQTIVLAGG